MDILSFPTRKLRGSIKKVTTRAKNVKDSQKLKVFGVSNIDGVVITGKESSDDKSNYIYVTENQFVYNPYRINIGSIGLTPKNFTGLVSPAYEVFDVNGDINKDFLFFYLKSPLGIKLIKWYGDRGGVRAALRFKEMEKIDFPDLTISDQEARLIKIKQIFEKKEYYKNYLSKSSENIRKLRQSILNNAIHGKLVLQDPNDELATELLKKIKAEKEKLIREGKIMKEKPLQFIKNEEVPYELPKGWEWCKFGELSQFISSGSREWAAYYADEGAKFIRMGNLLRNSFDLRLNSIKYVTPPKSGEGTRTRLEGGDYLISITGDVGMIGLVPNNFGEAYINQHIAIVRLLSIIRNKYFGYAFLSPLLQNQFNKPQRGIKNSFRLSDVQNLLIPIPPINEQKRIVEKVDKLMMLCDDLELKVKESINNADLFMQAVLQESFKNN